MRSINEFLVKKHLHNFIDIKEWFIKIFEDNKAKKRSNEIYLNHNLIDYACYIRWNGNTLMIDVASMYRSKIKSYEVMNINDIPYDGSFGTNVDNFAFNAEITNSKIILDIAEYEEKSKIHMKQHMTINFKIDKYNLIIKKVNFNK